MQQDTIYFYQVRNNAAYGCFSNFSKHKIHLDGKSWPTSEHYFQALKFAGLEMEETIRRTPGVSKAKKLGQTRTVKLRSDWEEVK